MERRKFIALGSAAVVWPLSHASLAADYKSEFKMSVIVTEDTAWGRAATRFWLCTTTLHFGTMPSIR